MSQSKFCLLPRGDQAWTMRLVDTLACSCIPVFIANNITLPFEEFIPWAKIALFYPMELLAQPETNATSLLAYLRAFRDEDLQPIQNALHEIFLEYFETQHARAVSGLHAVTYHYTPKTSRPTRFDLPSTFFEKMPKWDIGWDRRRGEPWLSEDPEPSNMLSLEDSF